MYWHSLLLSFSSMLSIAVALPTDESALASNPAGLSKRDDGSINLQGSCSDNSKLWAPVQAVGGSPGTEACETHFGTDYSPVTGVEVWLKGSGDKIAGIKLTYASGESSPVYGTPDTSKYQSNRFTTSPGETITSCVLYGDGQGHYLGHIHLETSTGQTFDSGATTSGRTPYQAQTGSGIMTGMQVATGGDGNSVVYAAFLFLKQPIDHIAISDIQYANNPVGSNSGIQPNSLFGGDWFNDMDTNQTYTYSQTYNVQKSYSFTQSTTSSFKLSNSVEFSGEVLGLGAKDTTEISWQLDTTTEQSWTSGTSAGVTCSANGSLLPHTGANVTGTFQTGNGNFQYSSNVEVFLKDGTSYKYTEKGQLNSVDYTQCQVSTTPANKPGKSNTTPLQNAVGGGGSKHKVKRTLRAMKFLPTTLQG